MSDTSYTNGVTLTDADWFNDVNRLHYTIFGDPSTIVAALKNIRAVGQGTLLNGVITASVAANALTLAVKGRDGNDPSESNPVIVAMRSATASSGSFNILSITGALSMVVSSGSTLGHASAIAQHVFVYLIDNAGTLELAASNLPPDYPGTFGKARLVSTTAEGGAGAADSATGVYSTTARSNVPWTCVAKMLSTQTTAGTWAANMTQVDTAPFDLQRCEFAASGTTSTGINTDTKMANGTVAYSPDGTFASGTHRPNIAGVYSYTARSTCAGTAANTILFASVTKNGSVIAETRFQETGATTMATNATQEVLMNGTSDYAEGYARQNDSNPLDVSSAFMGHRVTG